MKKFTGTREAFTAAIMDLEKEHGGVMYVSADTLKAMRATEFAEAFPRNYIEVGIAEQGAVCVGAGLASSGLTPYVATYAGFLTMRACEQMRTFVAYPNLNVKLVGVNAGVVGGEREGVTHQFYEDISIVQSFPNFKIFLPADAHQAYHAIKMAYETDGPVYVRLGSGREPVVYDVEASFNPKGVTVLADHGEDVVIFATGFILDRVMQAADVLKKNGVGVKVADVNIIDNSVRNSEIIGLLKNAAYAVTVEDHNINGGLGSYISTIACENMPKPVYRMGLNRFAESGPANELADLYGYTPEGIAAFVQAQAGMV